jgi:hypothetical protein
MSPLRRLRRAYLEWVEERVEEYKDSIPRSRLLALSDEVVSSLRLVRGGQYQLTEVMLCDAMNKRLARDLKLPGYREWVRRNSATVPSVSEQSESVPPRDSAQRNRAAIVIVWNPQVIDPDLYAEVVTALGDLARINGGVGLVRADTTNTGMIALSEVSA